MSISNKNLSPQQLAILGAIGSAVFSLLFSVLIQLNWMFILIITVGNFIFTYFIFWMLISNFIQNRIRLIYKMIAQTKATKKEEFYLKNILPEKSIEEVGKEVESWAEQRKMEFETLQKNETFRKEFLQNLSHELKTPIFAIQGYIETLVGGAINQPEVNMKFLLNASRNVDRLTTLINDLDEISRLESGELKVNYENFSILNVCHEVMESLEIKMQEKNIQASFKKESDQNHFVSADKEKIRQVITNLIDNAIKYGKQNGKVEIAFFKFDKSNLIVEISDDGNGIAEEHRSRIFERFYRIDTARTRKEGGSGLGLAICKHIVEAHQQSIHVRSTIDVGTTFVFSLALSK